MSDPTGLWSVSAADRPAPQGYDGPQSLRICGGFSEVPNWRNEVSEITLLKGSEEAFDAV